MKSMLFLLALLLITNVVNAQLPVYLPAEGLVGWYPFNNNTNDESGHDFNPTYVGTGVTLTADRFEIAGKAVDFNGNDFIRIPADSFPQDDRTVSLWFNVPDVSNRPLLLGYGGAGYLGYGTSYLMGLNMLGLASFHTQAHYNSNALNYYYENEPLNEWIHLVITIAGNQISCYVNGELKASNSAFIYSTYTTGKDLSFGVMPGADGIAPYTDINGGYLLGKLDDIGIWNRPLSTDEILQLYEASLTRVEHSEKMVFNCYPNPATNQVNLSIPVSLSGSELRVLNSKGQICLHTRISTPVSTLDVSMLPKGVYLLKLISSQSTSVRKILLK